MKIINYKKRNKFFALIILSLVLFATGTIALFCSGTDVFAHATEIEDALASNQAYLSAHYTDGTMGMIIDESYGVNDSVATLANDKHLQKTTVRSSGLSDEQSIVAVFLGDGFTKNEQQDFLDRVTEISNYMVTVEPFNYYKNYLTVYAVHSISNESGVSGEVGGVFACRDSAGNPATEKCTPVESSIFNCEHGRDTYYHSYYQWRSSANRVILEMTSADRDRARNDALDACAFVDMIQIIANSEMRGGTGQIPTKERPLGVALTSINSANPTGDWKQTIMHEFGHAFGGLWDEYWNGITPAEYPNMTQNSDTATVKWSQFIGFKNVGVYPFAASEWDGNPNQATNPWFRPHQNCIMRQTSNPFCPVCVQTLLDKMENKTGVSLSDSETSLFDITVMDSGYVRIDKLNVKYSGVFNIPESFNGKIVAKIGDLAFANQTNITNITLPSSINDIGNGAFLGCSGLTSISSLYSVKTIGNNAFMNCSALKNVTIPAGTTYVGDGVFSGCNNLAITVSASNPNYCAVGNILYSKDKKNLIATGKISSNITIPNTVTNINSYAFADNDNLQVLHFNNPSATIGISAFENCENLNSVYFYSYSVPQIGASAFAGNDFTLYVPYSSQSVYNSAFVGYTKKIDSIPININFMDDGMKINVLQTYFGARIEGLDDPFKTGYNFLGWYDNLNYTGIRYENGGLWDTTQDLTVYAKRTPRQFYVSFSGTGTEGLKDKLVTYDAPIGALPVLNISGCEFLGWKDEYGNTYNADTVWKRTSNLTLYSDYSVIEYNVVLDKQGGAGGSDSVKAAYLSNMRSATKPTKTGYTFQGYYAQPGVKGTKYYNSNMTSAHVWDIEDDATIYAYWKGNPYTVYLDTQNGTGGTRSVTATYGSPMPTSGVTAPTKTGYTFKGYFEFTDGNGAKYYDGPNIISVNEWDRTSSTTLYAYWEKNYYTITMRHEDSAGGMKYDYVKVAYGEKMPVSSRPYAPVRNGYEFLGYFSQPNGNGTKYYSKDIAYYPIESTSGGLTGGYREIMVSCNNRQ